MRGWGGGVFVAGAIACAITTSASCSYGTYDGSADDAASPGSLDIAFTPGAGVTRQTADRFLFVQILPDAFATATTVHVTRLADRQTSLTFPVFQITADAPLTGRIALQFNGANNNNSNPNLDPFAIGRLDATGTFVPLPLTGLEQNVAWGVIAALGTFTVDRAPIRGYDRDPGSPFRPSCFDKCCSGANGGVTQNRNAAGTKSGCFCYGEQGGGSEAAIDLQCFLGCADTKGEGERCAGRAFVEGTIECGGAGNAGSKEGCATVQLGGPLTGTPPCCLQPGGMGPGNICGLSGCTNPSGPIRRCGGKSNCPDGECCLFTDDNEYRCAATCAGQKL